MGTCGKPTYDSLRRPQMHASGPLNPDFLDVSSSDSQLTALSRCDEGSIKVIRGFVHGYFTDFQNLSLEAEIAAVAELLRTAQMQKCHQYWQTWTFAGQDE